MLRWDAGVGQKKGQVPSGEVGFDNNKVSGCCFCLAIPGDGWAYPACCDVSHSILCILIDLGSHHLRSSEGLMGS